MKIDRTANDRVRDVSWAAITSRIQFGATIENGSRMAMTDPQAAAMPRPRSSGTVKDSSKCSRRRPGNCCAIEGVSSVELSAMITSTRSTAPCANSAAERPRDHAGRVVRRHHD